MAIRDHQTVPVAGIVLNPKNYRHRPVESQEQALALLYGDDLKRNEMLALATDIAKRGLDPSNLPILAPTKDGYWRVLEGNRRLASLKVMASPDVLPELDGLSEAQLRAYKVKLGDLVDDADLQRDVLCFVTDDDEYADHLIYLKHTGTTAHRGAGTVLWDTEGRARYETSLGGQEDKPKSPSNRQAADGLALLDALAIEFAGDEEMEAWIEKARKRGLTILGRLLIRSEHQARLGVQVVDGTARFTARRPALRTAMGRVLTEMNTPRLNTRVTNTVADRGAYLDSIDEDLPVSSEQLDEPEAPSPPGDGQNKAKKSKHRKKNVPMARAFKDLTLHHASAKTQALLHELKSLHIEEYPYTLAIGIRSLIDLYTADVMRELKKPVADSPSERARQCLRLIEPANTPKRQRKFPRIHDALTGKEVGDLSIDTMNGFMHRETHNPSTDTIRKQVVDYEPWLRALDEHVDVTLTNGG